MSNFEGRVFQQKLFIIVLPPSQGRYFAFEQLSLGQTGILKELQNRGNLIILAYSGDLKSDPHCIALSALAVCSLNKALVNFKTMLYVSVGWIIQYSLWVYSGDPNSELVWYWNGPNVSDHWVIPYSNHHSKLPDYNSNRGNSVTEHPLVCYLNDSNIWMSGIRILKVCMWRHESKWAHNCLTWMQ